MRSLAIRIIPLLLLSSASAYAEVDLLKVRQAEKIAITLTGEPLSADLRAKVLS